MNKERKIAFTFLAAAAIVFAVFYFLNIGGIAGAGTAAASILAIGIAKATANRDKKS